MQFDKRKKEIRGITVKDKEIKLSQYTDDTTLILDGSEESLLESLKIIEHFGNISGLRLNDKKTEALWIGARVDWDFKLCPQTTSNSRKKKVRALGVWLSTAPNAVLSIRPGTRWSSGGYSVESRRVYFTAFKYQMEKKSKIIIDI